MLINQIMDHFNFYPFSLRQFYACEQETDTPTVEMARGSREREKRTKIFPRNNDEHN